MLSQHPFIDHLADLRDTFRRAFAEFLTIPTIVIAVFFLLAIGTHVADLNPASALGWLRKLLRSHVFSDSQATSDLLGTIAAGVITITSITISLLLLTLQQSASMLTSEVFDQFLRRKLNQFIFGFFIGLAFYALIILATVNAPFNPIFGAALAVLLTIVALYLLLILLYTAINQMRPVEIIETIRDHALSARTRQSTMVAQTRRKPISTRPVSRNVNAPRAGYITHIELTSIAHEIDQVDPQAEVILLLPQGSFAAFNQVMANVCAETDQAASRIADCVVKSIQLERQRDIAGDASYAIEQIETIGWTTISSSKSNPGPGLRAIHALHDLLARWSEPTEAPPPPDQRLPIVYPDDAFPRLWDAIESLAIASSESMQHQCFAEVIATVALTFGGLPDDQRTRARELVMRILSAMGDHVLSDRLDRALRQLAGAIEYSFPTTSATVENARAQLAQSVGRLNSRSTRVPSD